MIPVMGDRKTCLAREITKMYEEFMRGTLSEILENSEDLKGELVLIVKISQIEKKRLI